ncbi:hypothetical protein MBLNU457_6177t2 [Dothideomycetes sp. NU457]
MPSARALAHTSAAWYLRPFFQRAQQCQTRSASILSNLSDNPGAYNKRIRRGRGPSSGKGKTSGRGHKGQKQHGSVPVGFQGGQTPDIVVKGERGFENDFTSHMSPLNLNTLQSFIDAGRIDPSKPITVRELHDTRAVHGIKDGIKLLSRGAATLTTPIHIVVSRASASAIAAVEALGGTVTTRYYTRPAIARVLKGDSHPFKSLQSRAFAFEQNNSSEVQEAADQDVVSPLGALAKKGFKYRLPDPSSRKDLEYYRDPAHRGYLSYTVAEGQGPSLFFRTPSADKVDPKKNAAKARSRAAENRVW